MVCVTAIQCSVGQTALKPRDVRRAHSLPSTAQAVHCCVQGRHCTTLVTETVRALTVGTVPVCVLVTMALDSPIVVVCAHGMLLV